MPDMTKTELEKTVKKYANNGEVETAERYIRNFGAQITDYDVEEEVYKLRNPQKQNKKTVKEE
ncbi:hypothetical protein FGU46_03310 [Methanobacterium sp. CWC-01]|uniref:hypothetical protein n=1 Tax=Methanobacterium aridiramus TaxID=2584467 RepID=UPI002575B537|nr:hypothetical protein [Methanobacterium sp. CWC-01]WJI09188.1 hypothetical protein FGU46_03310 [Methanobacterium sp. CWC-01]